MKPKLFMIVSRFPYPLEKGDKLRAYYQIRELSEHFQIYLVCLSHSSVPEAYRRKIAVFCEELHVFRLNIFAAYLRTFFQFFLSKPFQVAYFYSYRIQFKINALLFNYRPDHIYCQLIRTSDYVKNYHFCSKSIDYMDALSIGMQRRSASSAGVNRWILREEALRLRNYERIIFDYFENKVMISEQDRSFIAHPKRQEILVIQNGVDASFFEEKERRPDFDLVFVGNLSYPPNVEAAFFLMKSLLPKLPERKLLLAGASPHVKLFKWSASSKNIAIQGWTEDIREVYKRGKIFVAPMFMGTGMQNKILEAMALGIPVVTTSLVNNAIQGKHGVHLFVADDLSQMVDCIQVLEGNQTLRESMVKNARAFVREKYSWSSVSNELIALMLR